MVWKNGNGFTHGRGMLELGVSTEDQWSVEFEAGVI